MSGATVVNGMSDSSITTSIATPYSVSVPGSHDGMSVVSSLPAPSESSSEAAEASNPSQHDPAPRVRTAAELEAVSDDVLEEGWEPFRKALAEFAVKKNVVEDLESKASGADNSGEGTAMRLSAAKMEAKGSQRKVHRTRGVRRLSSLLRWLLTAAVNA